jgi:ArsR family transcriptional regulator
MKLDAFERNAAAVARLMAQLSNPRRLMVMCTLADAGEHNVGQLSCAVGVSQSALSQHLARLREDGLVATRREAQTIWYRIADPRIGVLLALLHELYCSDSGEGN